MTEETEFEKWNEWILWVLGTIRGGNLGWLNNSIIRNAISWSGFSRSLTNKLACHTTCYMNSRFCTYSDIIPPRKPKCLMWLAWRLFLQPLLVQFRHWLFSTCLHYRAVKKRKPQVARIPHPHILAASLPKNKYCVTKGKANLPQLRR